MMRSLHFPSPWSLTFTNINSKKFFVMIFLMPFMKRISSESDMVSSRSVIRSNILPYRRYFSYTALYLCEKSSSTCEYATNLFLRWTISMNLLLAVLVSRRKVASDLKICCRFVHCLMVRGTGSFVYIAVLNYSLPTSKLLSTWSLKFMYSLIFLADRNTILLFYTLLFFSLCSILRSYWLRTETMHWNSY